MKKVLLFLLNILKHIILFPLYYSMPNKYSGESYEEWLGEKKENKEESENESKFYH